MTTPVRQAVRVGAALLLAAVSSCGGRSLEADVGGSTEVAFESTDGVQLQGRLFGDGDAAVVLSHMRPADQTSWFRFADRLADAGYLVLTYNFRGYCPGGDGGCSEGDLDIDAIWHDVVGAIAFVRSRGATSVSLVGASMGGTASLVAAAQEDVEVRAVITLSAPASIEGLVADRPLLLRISAGKLYLAGVGDPSAAADAQALYERSPPPKRVEIVPSDDHGTDLLTGGQAEVVRRQIETYLEQVGGP